MKVLLIYDEDGPDRREAGSALAAWVKEGGHELESVCASSLALKPCLGCFGCWIKTPGRCVVSGDGWEGLIRSMVGADLVVLAGSIPYGSFSAPIKAVLDRWLPALLPYFRRFRGEMHHVPRYARRPRIVSMAFGEALADEESTHLELVRSFCDNADSPRQKRFFRFASGAAEPATALARASSLARWLDEEVA